ncbi:metallophosphoesterase [Mariniphaga sediminis]|uniref:metallophosphoesterase n=1 Tax=Mariniphaga sediminis TaxID=1628158 RepID=UPI0035656C96
MTNLKVCAGIVLLLLGTQVIRAEENKSVTINHGPYLQNVSQNTISVVFSTDALVVPGVMLYGKGEKPVVIKNSHDGLIDVGEGIHKVEISGLKPGTSYSYKAFGIKVVDYQPYKCVFGDTVYSALGTFKTVEPDKEGIKFTVFNDVHDKAWKIGKYLDHNAIDKQDFYILNGDILGHIDEEAQMYSSFIDTCVSRFAQNIPFFYVRGNHETRGAYARELKKFLVLDNDSYYYAFSRGPARFVVLDGGEDKPDDNIEYSGLADFDAFREKQLEWLKREIAGREFLDAEVKIVVIHMPIIENKENWYGMAQLAEHYGPVLRDAGIDLMISGHTHTNEWIDSEKSGFGYPVIICSHEDFLEVELDATMIKCEVKGMDGKVVQSQHISLQASEK